MTYKKSDLIEFANIVEDLTGITLDHNQEFLIEKRLKSTLELLRKTKVDKTFFDCLKNKKDIESKLISMFTNNETSFFRDKLPFDFIVKNVQESESEISIASVASSTGQEPLSIVISLKEAGVTQSKFSINAYDIDEKALHHPLDVGYRQFELNRGINEELQRKYFVVHDRKFFPKEEILTSVKFKQFNILKDNFNLDFNIIFCRNLLFYFNEENKMSSVDKLTRHLTPNGILVLGNGEKVVHQSLEEKSWNGLVYYVKK
ncbi:MAG: hypothetical protein CME69_11360 [Halobacteriovorax sp.]|nr:hypothetical protein [Halobacteriovorax sp.]